MLIDEVVVSSFGFSKCFVWENNAQGAYDTIVSCKTFGEMAA